MTTLAAPDMGGTGILKGGTMVLSVKPNREGNSHPKVARSGVPGGTEILLHRHSVIAIAYAKSVYS